MKVATAAAAPYLVMLDTFHGIIKLAM